MIIQITVLRFTIVSAIHDKCIFLTHFNSLKKKLYMVVNKQELYIQEHKSANAIHTRYMPRKLGTDTRR